MTGPGRKRLWPFTLRGSWEWYRSQGFGWVRATWCTLRDRVWEHAAVVGCWLLGHRYEAWADGENGTEEVECVRCGEYWRFQW